MKWGNSSPIWDRQELRVGSQGSPEQMGSSIDSNTEARLIGDARLSSAKGPSSAVDDGSFWMETEEVAKWFESPSWCWFSSEMCHDRPTLRS